MPSRLQVLQAASAGRTLPVATAILDGCILVTFSTAAATLGVSNRTAERLVAQGQLRSCKIDSRTVRIPLCDVEQLAAQRKRSPRRGRRARVPDLIWDMLKQEV